MIRKNQNNSRYRPRGAVAVQVMTMLVVLIGFAAITIDVGNLYVVKAELQNAADSAAMAGASAFAEDQWSNGTAKTTSGEFSTDTAYLTLAAKARAQGYAKSNSANGRHILLEDEDIIIGKLDSSNTTKPVDPTGAPNAIQTTTRFDAQSVNGPVQNFFAQVLGFKTTDVSATAVAVFQDGLAKYTPPEASDLLPFTIHKDLFDQQLADGPDNYQYDDDLDVVKEFSDGTSEFVLYPYKDWADSSDGAGNFGTLNVGVDNQGTSDLGQQILSGISPEELEAETGYPELTFAADDGTPQDYEITGNTGLSVGLESYVEQRIGEVIGFFLHTTVVSPGSNATYTIVSIRFARLMAIDLTGSPDTRQIVLQPVVHTDEGVTTDPDAPSTDGLIGRITLVR